ncbi:MAG: hypothetical protein KKH94_06540 [Candidatus Omnitrophica bacterium]|nr:hypothetical protein [Candidatus Omnitrophota bacterium]
MGEEKIPERVAVLEVCYKNLKKDLFGGNGKPGAFPALEGKVEDVKKLFTNHLGHLKQEQIRKEEEFKTERGKWSRRRFDILKIILNAILVLAVSFLVPIGICLISKITSLNLGG